MYKAHPEYDYTLLVRNEERGRLVAEKYPDVKFVYGTLDDAEVLEKAAAAADIIVRMLDRATRGVEIFTLLTEIRRHGGLVRPRPSGESSHKGGRVNPLCREAALLDPYLRNRHPAMGERKGLPNLCVWIRSSQSAHTQYDTRNKRFGQPPMPDQKYEDVDGIDRVLTLPDDAHHRDCDIVVLAANDSPGVKTAIVGPPTIYGPGRGPGNQRSMQVYDMCKFMLRNGYAPVINTGETEWDNVHIHDLSAFLLTLVEAAQDPSKQKDPELFGSRAYYFLEHDVHVWGEVAAWLAEEAHKQGYLPAATTKTVTMEEICAALGVSNSSWGCNSKSVAQRARKYFAWTPDGQSLKDEIPAIVASEAAALGVKPTK